MVSRRTWQATNGQLRTHASCSRDHAAVPVDASAASPPLGMVSMFIATASNLCLCKVHPRSSRRWQHAHLYTEDHHKVFPAALVQSSIVRIWGQAQGPLAAPLHDVLHRRVPLRAAPLPLHVVLVRDLEWPGATNDEARRKWLGMWLGTWFFSRHEAKMALRHEAKMAAGCLTGMVTIINHQHVLGV